MSIDFDKYKDIKIDKEKFKDIPTNVEQLRNCLAICYILMEDKDKEIERLNNIITELEKWLVNSYYIIPEGRGTTSSFNTYIKIRSVFDKLKELKGSDKE